MIVNLVRLIAKRSDYTELPNDQCFPTPASFNRAHDKHVFIPCSDFLYSSPFRTAAWARLFLFCPFILSSSGTALWAHVFLLCSSLCVHRVFVSSGGPFLHPHCAESSHIPPLPSVISSSRTAFFATPFICHPPLLLCELTCFFSIPFFCHRTLRYPVIVPRCFVSSRVPFRSRTGLWAHLFISCSIILWSSRTVLWAHVFLTCSSISRCSRPSIIILRFQFLLQYSPIVLHCSGSRRARFLPRFSLSAVPHEHAFHV